MQQGRGDTTGGCQSQHDNNAIHTANLSNQWDSNPSHTLPNDKNREVWLKGTHKDLKSKLKEGTVIV